MPAARSTSSCSHRGNDCSDNATAVYSSTGVPVDGNGSYSSANGTESGSNTATQSGTYHWAANYSVTPTTTRPTRPVLPSRSAISPNALSSNTTPSADTGAIGDVLTDQATLSGATAGTGPARSTSSCSHRETTAPTARQPSTKSTGVPVDSNGSTAAPTAPSPGSNTATQSGTYHWAANYSIDANNDAANSACAAEPVVISPNAPELNTTPSADTGAIGDVLTDQATLSGATAGAAADRLLPVRTGRRLLRQRDSRLQLDRRAGRRQWLLQRRQRHRVGQQHGHPVGHLPLGLLLGDANNDAANSACAAEPVVISPNAPELNTTPSADTGCNRRRADRPGDPVRGHRRCRRHDRLLPVRTGELTAPTTRRPSCSSTGVPVGSNNSYSSANGTESGSNTRTPSRAPTAGPPATPVTPTTTRPTRPVLPSRSW